MALKIVQTEPALLVVWETENGHRGGTLHTDSASHFILVNISNCSVNKGYLPFLNSIKVVCPLKMVSLRFHHEIVSAIVLLHVFRKSTLSLIAVSVNSVRTFVWEDAVIQYPLHVTLLSTAIAPIQINNTLPFLFFFDGFSETILAGKGLLNFSQSLNLWCDLLASRSQFYNFLKLKEALHFLTSSSIIGPVTLKSFSFGIETTTQTIVLPGYIWKLRQWKIPFILLFVRNCP